MACSKIFILRIEGDTRTPAFFNICPYISCVSDVSGGPLLFRTSLLTWLFPLPGAPWDPWANKHPQTSDIGCEFKEGHALILYIYYIIYYITYCMPMRFNWRYSGSEKLLAQVSISQQNSKNTKQRVGSAPSRLWQQCPTQAFRIQACQQNGGNTLQRSISGSLNVLQSFSPTDFQTSLWGNKAGLRHVLAEGGTRRAGRITHLEIAMYCCHLMRVCRHAHLCCSSWETHIGHIAIQKPNPFQKAKERR
jgi:hypothetical protein